MPNKQNKQSTLRLNRGFTNSRMTVQASIDVEAIRTETHLGVDHLVVPVVALVEGVLFPSNAPFNELALASEFGKQPQGWNGRPIVFDHPVRNGVQVSANSPEILESEAFGQLFNTRLDGKKLKTEAWINLERVAELGDDVIDAVERIKNDDTVEVSTGLFISLEVVSGTFEDEEFGGIWREVVPDHLAILPKGTVGACSVADGCGAPRLNAAHIDNTCECDAGGDSDMTDNTGNDNSERKGFFQSLSEKFTDLFNTFRSQGLSDNDTRTALEALLRREHPNEFIWIIAVFHEEGEFVYELGFDGTTLKRTFEVDGEDDISIGEETTEVRPVTTFVSLTEEQENDGMPNPEAVAAVIANEANQFTEDDTEFLSGLPDEQFSKIEALSQSQEESAESAAPEATPAEANEPPSEASNDAGVAQGSEETARAASSANSEETPETPEDFISKAPKEMQDVLGEGLRLHRANKDALVKGILANSKNTFTKEQLGKMDLDYLSSLAQLAEVPDYSGGGGNRFASAHEDDNAAPEAPLVFPVAQAN